VAVHLLLLDVYLAIARSVRLCGGIMVVELKRVLISDALDSSCQTILTEGGLAVDYRPGISKEDLLACVNVCSISYFVALTR
jgi:hypothetical protein